MKKLTKLSIQWFYDLLEKGECALVDFKEQLEDKVSFGKSLKSFSSSYEELARDVVAFANYKGGFLFIGIDSVGKINNPEARELLKLEPKDVSHVSRLFKELLESEDIVILSEKSKNQRVYGRKK